MEATIEFAPAIPFPRSFDVQKRIQELRGYLDPNNPNYQPEQQHTNIKAAIKLYEDGKIDGVEQVFIIDGKVVPKKEIFRRPQWPTVTGLCRLLEKACLAHQKPVSPSAYAACVQIG
jgi:hypothetical protein